MRDMFAWPQRAAEPAPARYHDGTAPGRRVSVVSEQTMTAAPPRTSYDEVPYDSKAFSETHPDRLATVATLFGMRPRDVEHSRVLELGCADGSNLIPMAVGLPESTFVGVDLSPRQVGDGQTVIEALGLKNISLRAASILDVGAADGIFDYIVCHGVYSWVPPEVQDHILAICKRNLAPDGVAYVSYNTYPGWHVRRMVRDLLCYHARRVADPREQVRQARAFIDFLGQYVVADPTSTYAPTIRGAAESLRQKSDSYLLHEYLEEHNEPLYFYQFAERARQHGLQYLGDANLATMMTNKLATEAQETLGRLAGDLIQLEQYLDFLQNRPFRRTLLCHEGIALNRVIRPEALATLYVSTLARPAAPAADLLSDSPQEFRSPEGHTLTTREPLLKAAMLHLVEVSPGALSLERLWNVACEHTAGAPAPATRDSTFLAGRLLNYYLSGIVQLQAHPSRFVSAATNRPLGSPLARYQAARSKRVTNLRHELIELSELGRQVLSRLDGRQEREQILATLLDLVTNQVLRLERNGQPINDPQEMRDPLGVALDQALAVLARSACLVA